MVNLCVSENVDSFFFSFITNNTLKLIGNMIEDLNFITNLLLYKAVHLVHTISIAQTCLAFWSCSARRTNARKSVDSIHTCRAKGARRRQALVDI